MAREKRYYVYIMASIRGVLYVGVTGFLYARVLQHKSGETDGFTRRYRVHKLVYYESFRYVNNAIARETEIKKWRREKKVALIEAGNPTWGKPAGMRQIPPPPLRSAFGMTRVERDVIPGFPLRCARRSE
jgi:putative endonuclease